MSRAEHELNILSRIGQILSDGLEIDQAFMKMMRLLQDEFRVQRAALVLWNQTQDQLETMASIGLSEAERQRGRYALGEGVTGRVIASGEPAIIPDIAADPEFLNRTGARKLADRPEASAATGSPQPVCFVCVPVKDREQTVGAISVDKFFESDEALAADTRLLQILGGMISQAVRLYGHIRIEKNRWLEEKQRLNDDLRSRYQFDNIIGTSPAMHDVLSVIAQVSSSRATVLVLGETGCGKEMVAKAIHYNSPRKDKPLIRVNCGALSPQLLESELFGHVKGAFTGAVRDKVGRFEAADGGTIFLDEIGTLDPQLQIKLLRVLQEREFERVGDHHTIKVDVRIIAATNLDLEEESRNGNFRQDLYYRLNVVTVQLPPLRSRREDIPQLIDHFLERFNRENGRNLSRMSRGVLQTLLRYPWPGNVRELENCMERAVVLSKDEDLTYDLLPLQIRMFAQQTRGDEREESLSLMSTRLAEAAVKQYLDQDGEVYNLVVGEVERELIRHALEHTGGVKTRAADFLGINRNTLNKKVKELES